MNWDDTLKQLSKADCSECKMPFFLDESSYNFPVFYCKEHEERIWAFYDQQGNIDQINIRYEFWQIHLRKFETKLVSSHGVVCLNFELPDNFFVNLDDEKLFNFIKLLAVFN